MSTAKAKSSMNRSMPNISFRRDSVAGIATFINVPTGDSIVVHAEGDYNLGPIAAPLKQQLNGFRPHLARSSLVSARLAFERARTAVETLSGLGLAACAVTRAGTVLVANPEFDARRTAVDDSRGQPDRAHRQAGRPAAFRCLERDRDGARRQVLTTRRSGWHATRRCCMSCQSAARRMISSAKPRRSWC